MAETKFTLPEIYLEKRYRSKAASRFAAGRFSPDTSVLGRVVDTNDYDIIDLLVMRKVIKDANIYDNILKIKKLKPDIERSYITNTPLIDSKSLPPYHKPAVEYRRIPAVPQPGQGALKTAIEASNDACDYAAYDGYFYSLDNKDPGILMGNLTGKEVLRIAANIIYNPGGDTRSVKSELLTAKGINADVAKYIELYFLYARLAQLLNVLLVGFNNATKVYGTEARLKNPNDPMGKPLKIPQFTKPTLELDLPKSAVDTLLTVVPLTAAQLDKLNMMLDTAGILKASKVIVNQ